MEYGNNKSATDPVALRREWKVTSHNPPRAYNLSNPDEFKRLMSETWGYLRTCKTTKCGGDFAGRQFAMDALKALSSAPVLARKFGVKDVWDLPIPIQPILAAMSEAAMSPIIFLAAYCVEDKDCTEARE